MVPDDHTVAPISFLSLEAAHIIPGCAPAFQATLSSSDLMSPTNTGLFLWQVDSFIVLFGVQFSVTDFLWGVGAKKI